MRYWIKAVLLASFFVSVLGTTFGSAAVSAKGLDAMLKELRSGDVSLQTIAALAAMDQPDLKVGYGLCAASGGMLCKTNGSVGYGLCEVSGAQLCKVDGSLGYGLCTLAGGLGCNAKGSLGYGLCTLAGELNCRP